MSVGSEPTTSYAICAVQRSGSFLLCEAMKLTRVAGNPEEYFLVWEDSDWAQEHGATTRRAFLDLVLAQGSSPNGVFGIKLMWNYFPEVVSRLRDLPGCTELDPPTLLARLFPNLHYIWIVRKDKVRQAVSWAIAAQTNIFVTSQLEYRTPKQDPRFDFEFIDNLHGLVVEGEAGWRAHFDACGVEPLKILYEDLVEDYEGTALRALAHLGLSPLDPPLLGERRMARQATSLNDEWVERYLELKSQSPGPAAV